MTPFHLRNRVLFAGVSVFGIVALRLIFVSDPAIGMLVTYTANLTCLAYFWHLIDSTPVHARGAYLDLDSSDQGWDPRTIEAMRRRAEGIE